MKNILLVFTGGTIGSSASNGTINTHHKQGYKLLELFKNNYPDSENFVFKSIQPIQLLSENLTPRIWELLIKSIEAENIAQYDGIIVTHGTDTLAFTAAALSLYFNSINIPLLLVSSDYHLDHPLANGLTHLVLAIEFIKQRNEAGIFIPYKNQNSKALVHLGTRLASCLQLSNDFISVQSKAYLTVEKNVFHQQNTFNLVKCKPVQLAPDFSTSVLLIRPYPGLDYSHFVLDQVDVVLHDLYHSGTSCSTKDWGKNHSLLKFIEKCKQNNIELYMAPAIKNTETYSSTQSLIDHGAIMIWNMSLECAYVKLLLAYGNYNDKESIKQFLQQTIAFEHCIEDL